MFGKDFFKIFHFIVQILKLLTEIFGTDEDKQEFGNHVSDDVKFIEDQKNKETG